jgi:hypothetical protein
MSSVEIVVTGDDRSGPALDSATGRVRAYVAVVQEAGTEGERALDRISDSADLTSHFVRDLTDEFRTLSTQASPALDRAADGIADVRNAAERATPEVHDLGEAVEDVGDPAGLAATAAGLREVGDQAEHARDRISHIGDGAGGGGTAGRSFLAGLIPDMDRVRDLGRQTGSALSEAATDAVSGLPMGIGRVLAATGPVGAGVMAVSGVMIASALSAAVAGALLGGMGAGAIAAGIAGAAQDARVKTAAGEVKAVIVSEFQQVGAEFADPVLKSLAQMKTAASDLNLSDSFAPLAATIQPLTDGIIGFANNAMPGFNRALAASEPIIDMLADELPGLGDSVSQFMDSMAAAGPGAEKFFHILIEGLGTAVEMIGGFIETGAQIYDFIAGVEEAIGLWDFSDTEKDMRQVGETSGEVFPAVVDAVNAVTDAQEAAKKAAEDLANGLRGIFDGAIALQEGMFKLTDSVKENGHSLDQTSRKGLENVKVIRSMVDAAMRQADAAREASIASGDAAGAEAAATRVREAAIQKILAHAAASGLDAAQVQALIHQLQGLPTGDRYLNYNIRTIYTVQREEAEQRSFGSGYAGIPGHSEGGPVEGPGTPTSDNLLRRLSPGEHVMTTAEVNAAGGHGEVAALRRALLAGAAKGGGGTASLLAGAAPSGSGGGARYYTINAYALDPVSARDLVMDAIDSFERDNGARWVPVTS